MPTTLDPNAINPGANPPGNGLLNTATTSALAPAGGPPPVGGAPNAPAATYTASQGTAGVAAPSSYTATPYNANSSLAKASSYTATPYNADGTVATASSYAATPYAVQNEGLVENRIQGIVKADSPLMQQARDLANARSNERGMLNSSIGTAAAQSAVIGAAAPIATSDAGSINTAMTNSANARNAASQFNTGQENETARLNANLRTTAMTNTANAQNAASQYNTGQENEAARLNANLLSTAMTNTANAQNAAGQFNTGQANEAERLNANLLSQMNAVNANAENAALNLQAQAQNAQIMSRLDQSQKIQMQQVMQDNQVLLQQNTAAAQLAQQTMTNIANIQTSSTLDEANKQIDVNAQLDFLHASLRTINQLAVETPERIASLGIQEIFTGGISGSGVTGGQNYPVAERAALAATAKSELAKSAQFNATAATLKTQLAAAPAAQKAALQAQLTQAYTNADAAFVLAARSSTPGEYKAMVAQTKQTLDSESAARHGSMGNLIELNRRPDKYPRSEHDAANATVARTALTIPRAQALYDQLVATGGPL